MTKIEVSDHALIRWLERVHGIDMEALREELRAFAAPFIAAGALSLSQGDMTFEVRNGVLTTVMPRKFRKYAESTPSGRLETNRKRS